LEITIVEDLAEGSQAPLTKQELIELERCEKVLQRGLNTFFEVGNALLTIRDGRLYRANYPTFASYCRERWGIDRTYAWRIIGATERLRMLPADGVIPRPTNEFQVRPFLTLAPRVFPRVWKQAIKRANGGRITAALVRSLLSELHPNGASQSIKGNDARRQER
jgi:hypothetical protein